MPARWFENFRDTWKVFLREENSLQDRPPHSDRTGCNYIHPLGKEFSGSPSMESNLKESYDFFERRYLDMRSHAVVMKSSISFRLRDVDVTKIIVIIASIVQLLMMMR